VLWSSWLNYTAPEPPTPEELINWERYNLTVAYKVQLIEEGKTIDQSPDRENNTAIVSMVEQILGANNNLHANVSPTPMQPEPPLSTSPQDQEKSPNESNLDTDFL